MLENKHVSKVTWQLNYKTVQEINVGLLTVQWCFEDQRQIFKPAIVHDPSEAVGSDSSAANARMMVHV